MNKVAELGTIRRESPTVGGDGTLAALVDTLVDGYRSDPRGHRIGHRFFPSREAIVQVAQLCLEILYPGYYGAKNVAHDEVLFRVGVTVGKLRELLVAQVEQCLCHDEEDVDAAPQRANVPRCQARATRVADAFLMRLPALRSMLLDDLQAAYDGDPAAESVAEILLSYPGFLAITVYRLAHELHLLGVPLMPRILTEWAHTKTGADLHPAATIGPRFFIDHATGVVVGETTVIGAHVKLYQGVTLGALSIARDADGRVIRGSKRHPTVEDEVTIYANATVLGGNTVLGRGAVIGGSVFVTRSVPPGSRVSLRSPELQVRSVPPPPAESGPFLDFEI